jgi:hypothetical protein
VNEEPRLSKTGPALIPTPNPLLHDGFWYDAVLSHVDNARSMLTFTVAKVVHRVQLPHANYFSAGAVGRLRLAADGVAFAFHLYADQRLRRLPELDVPRERRWGWSVGDRRVLVEAGILPGRNGNVIKRDTESLALELPREFWDYCGDRGLTPREVLGAFVSDLCELTSLYESPREDGFCSNGSDERDHANQYFQRCFGWVDDPAHRAKVRAAKRGARRDV